MITNFFKTTLFVILFLSASGFSQQVVKKISFTFGDSTELYVASPYGPTYIVVADTGTTYRDTIKVYAITHDGDTVLALSEDLNNATANTFVSFLSPGANTAGFYKVKIEDVWKLWLVRSNVTNIVGRRTKAIVYSTKHLQR